MESMSDLVASETLTCECLRCLCHSDSNLNVALGDGCIFLCGFIRLATVTLIAGEGCGFSFTRSLFWGWSYHPNCWCGREHGLLAIEVKVHHRLWLQSIVSGLLSLVKVYLCLFLHSKLDEVVIGRPLICSLAID